MLNFMGLGFSFGGKDAGLSRAVDGALASVSRLTAGIAGVSTVMGDLAEKGRDPTTNFEAAMIANNVESTKMAANLGKTGKAIGAFSKDAQNMALMLNRSIDATGSAIGEFERLGDAATKTGIDTKETMLKLVDVSGVSARTFADSGVQLKKMFGMTAEAGARVMDVMTKAGQAVGDVPGALADLPHRMDILQRKASLLARGVKGIGVEELSKQMDVASTSMQKATGVSAAAARAFGTGLADSLVQAQDAFANLTVGTGEDIPEAMKAMALTTGSVEKTFKLMGEGPETFMDTMRQMTKNMGGDKVKIGQLMTWISAKTGEAFGPERSKDIVNYLAAATDQTDKQGKAVEKATGSLQKYAKEGFKSGRTAAESLALSEDLFVTKIRSLNDRSWEFARNASKSYKLLGGEIANFAADKGPVGSLTNALVDLDHKGLVGLLPDKLQGTAVALGGFTKRLGKTLEGILNPLSLVESGFVLFGTAMTHAFMQTDKKLSFMTRLKKAFKSVTDDVVKYLGELPKKINGVVSDIFRALGKMLGPSSAGKTKSQIGRWWDAILKFFTDMKPILNRLKIFAIEFWKGLTDTLDPDQQENVGTKLGKWIRSGWDTVVTYFNANILPEIKTFGQDFWDGLTNTLDPTATTSAPDSPGKAIGRWIHDAFLVAVKWVEDNLGPLLDKLFEALVSKVKDKTIDAAKSLALGAANVATGGAAGWVMDRLKGDPDSATPAAPKAGVTRAAPSPSNQSVQAVEQLASTTAEAEKAQKQRDMDMLEIAKQQLELMKKDAKDKARDEAPTTRGGTGGTGSTGGVYTYKNISGQPRTKK